MKISTKGRYALRVMIDIAIHSNGRCVSIKEIAGRQEISEKYLEQIFHRAQPIGIVAQHARRAGGLYSHSRSGGLYGGHDPAGAGRRSGAGGLRGAGPVGVRPLPACGAVRHMGGLGADSRCG